MIECEKVYMIKLTERGQEIMEEKTVPWVISIRIYHLSLWTESTVHGPEG